ncbi:MAG: hypothetical protein NE327_07090 [Lentisphaeraceae bacterium]|nr:hypothetical protein [Lentisphaeraceae bacterium]
MNSHTISLRKPTASEFNLIQKSTKTNYVSIAYLIIIFGVVPFFLFGDLFGWIGSFIEKQELGKSFGRLSSFVFFIYFFFQHNKYEKKSKRDSHKDLSLNQVEDISVETDTVYNIELVNDNEPIFAFDIGQGKILYLQGQWIRDYETYGLENDSSVGDVGDEYLNSLPEPYSFPQDKFTVSRFQNTGEVFKIKLEGSYLSPVKEVDVLKDEFDFKSSELFEGNLDNLETVLLYYHAKKPS